MLSLIFVCIAVITTFYMVYICLLYPKEHIELDFFITGTVLVFANFLDMTLSSTLLFISHEYVITKTFISYMWYFFFAGIVTTAALVLKFYLNKYKIKPQRYITLIQICFLLVVILLGARYIDRHILETNALAESYAIILVTLNIIIYCILFFKCIQLHYRYHKLKHLYTEVGLDF